MQQPSDGPCDETSSAIVEAVFDADGALSRAFLIRRGFCCELGCKNCPYRDAGEQNANVPPE